MKQQALKDWMQVLLVCGTGITAAVDHRIRQDMLMLLVVRGYLVLLKNSSNFVYTISVLWLLQTYRLEEENLMLPRGWLVLPEGFSTVRYVSSLLITTIGFVFKENSSKKLILLEIEDSTASVDRYRMTHIWFGSRIEQDVSFKGKLTD
ncbi:hypothetical protein Tco_0783944 [Tanacetum coccineum]